MRADLHSHSNYSDGWYKVSEVVERAKEHNLNILGLTDHDSVFGVDEAFEYGKKIGVFVLKGCELSTKIGNDNCHLVCYWPNNVVPQEMYKFSQDIIDKRRERAIKMANLIQYVKIYLNVVNILKNVIIIKILNQKVSTIN